jgi:hypothetical protein
VDSGQNSIVSSENFAQGELPLKMLGTLPEKVSMSFSEILPPAGMMRSGRLYTLPHWERPTIDADSSFLPFYRTPTARDYKGMSAKSWRNRKDGDRTPTLPDQIGGTPHPDFVESLMGFQTGHTELKP